MSEELIPPPSQPSSSSGGLVIEDVATDSYVVSLADNNKLLRFTNAALVTVTLGDGLPVAFMVNLLFWGAAGGAIQDDGVAVVQVEGTVAQYGEVSCAVVATDTWSVQGAIA